MFFNFLKKFKKAGEAGTERFRARQREKETEKKRGDATEESKAGSSELFESQTAAGVLLSPHVTEKSTRLADAATYVFKVKNRATKPQIKRAIEELYRVKVNTVNVLNQKPKTRILRRIKGIKSGYKKAQVILFSGQKIEFV